MHITLEQAIATYGTEQYKLEMKSRLKDFGLEKYKENTGNEIENADF